MYFSDGGHENVFLATFLLRSPRPNSVDRFANYINSKIARFNSRYWNPGAEGVDAFVMDWSGQNNYVCPPICLIPRVLLHMSNCKAQETLIIPLWYSAPFWPMICGEYIFREFVLDCIWTYRLIKTHFALVTVASFLETKT